jgi:hypothetical protein
MAYTFEKYPSPELSFALEKTLRERYRIFDIQRLAKNAAPEDRNAFLVRIHGTNDSSIPGLAMAVLNFLSGAIIPATWRENYTLLFTVVAPDGQEKSFHYSWSERVYSWLPMIVFGPKFTVNISTELNYYQDERLRILDEIMKRFMDDASRFILVRAAVTGTENGRTLL